LAKYESKGYENKIQNDYGEENSHIRRLSMQGISSLTCNFHKLCQKS